jgi:NMD protein affecting ribosome stability and mRNA decay
MRVEMSETQTELCGKCGAEIELSRRVDFTLKDGTRVCDSCFIKETPRTTRPARDWSN